jgi:3-isopropylmalate/(R)-2-methylmalate dehydratase small subunit
MKEFKGNVLFLDRSDINTDEIIPARYLTEIEKTALKPHLLEDLKLNGFDPKKDIESASMIVTRENFGCGSSREHAPWALEVNGIQVVMAVSFARIFRQNMFNCGMPAIELPEDEINTIFKSFSKDQTRMTVNIEKGEINLQSKDQNRTTNFRISEFDRALIQTGGWVEYADRHY